mmetsp:Transcript_28005/g.59725  ORF Transcript_28005/g.59725 Transcript_28005/m.59725 type:complete len:217 (+) Transcript_28005:1447-2097(+)
MSHHRHTSVGLIFSHRNGVLSHFLLQVAEVKTWDGSTFFWSVLSSLKLLQLHGLIDDILEFFLGKRFLDLGKTVFLLLELFLLERLRWEHLHSRPMTILQQKLLNRICEDFRSIRGNTRLQISQWFLKLERISGTAVIHPFPHAAQHQRQSLGKRSRVEFTHLKLNGIHRRSNGIFRKTISCDLLQYFHNKRFNLVNIFCLDSLETHAERRLQQIV